MDCGPTTYRTLCAWMPTSGSNVPYNAVVGGVDSTGETLYHWPRRHSDDVIPGKVVPSHNCCYVAFAGEENSHQEYEILVSPSEAEFEWVASDNGRVPTGAVQGGQTEDGEVLYIGRAYHEGSIVIGKIQPSHNCCYVAYDGGEHPHHEYEVLCCKAVHF